jgi:anti-sigma B factor antagonist
MTVVESPDGWTVTGEIDSGTCASLAEAFTDTGRLSGRTIEVDLAGVSFIDSSGLRTLLELAQRSAATGGRVEIRNPSRTVKRLLAMTQLGSTFGLSDCDRSAP